MTRIEQAYDSHGRIVRVGDRVSAKPAGCAEFYGVITQIQTDSDADITDVWVADEDDRGANDGAVVSECRVTKVKD